MNAANLPREKKDESSPILTVGVVADTHVPDRVANLHPQLLEVLQERRVSRILHAGDISTPAVIEELERIAPVTAACGNRDWVFQPPLPPICRLELAGVKIALMHGHGTWLNYILDKIQYTRHGYRRERYLDKVVMAAGAAAVVIFGHTHTPENFRYCGKLIFNPGSAGLVRPSLPHPSLGMLVFHPGGVVEAEIIHLDGTRLQGRRWV